MEDSILKTIKQMLGIFSEDESFDMELVVYINSAISSMNHLGVGPDGFAISGYNETWSDLLAMEAALNDAKQYLYLKVKTVFDPPESATVLNAFNEVIKEHAWHLANFSNKELTEGVLT